MCHQLTNAAPWHITLEQMDKQCNNSCSFYQRNLKSLPTLMRLKTDAYSFLGDAQFCKTILFWKKSTQRNGLQALGFKGHPEKPKSPKPSHPTLQLDKKEIV